MTDENWYLRNRSREMIISSFRVARELQLINNFKDSEVMRVLASVYRETGGSLVNLYLYYVIHEIEGDERRRPRRK